MSLSGVKKMRVAWASRLPAFVRSCRGRRGTDLPRAYVTTRGENSRVLGIESSCDDTGVAVVEGGGRIVTEKIATQTQIHAQWGGVVPRLAQEAHSDVIERLVAEALSETPSPDAVAVTVGPGLSLCLRVGVEAAMRLSEEKSIPLIPIHHMEAHALVARISDGVQFPFLCLLVSGGHNLLLVVHGIGNYTQIGTTIDDSLGEAYDKVARMLELELVPSGGAALEEEARKGDPFKYCFKLPMQQYPNCDFSYSGLKTSVRLTIEREQKEHPLTPQAKADIAASFQHVAVQHLQDKCRRGLQWALDHVPGLHTSFVVSGGVAANAFVRERLEHIAKEFDMKLLCPPPRLCTDNGVMVAWAGMERYPYTPHSPPYLAICRLLAGQFEQNPVSLRGEAAWIDLRPRWPLTDRFAFSNQNKRAPKRKRLHTSLTTLTERQLPALTTLALTETFPSG